MPIKLTKRSVDAARAADERQYLFDSELRGFGLAIQPTGAKTFFVQYRVAGGRRGSKKRVAIGRYGKVTVDQARAIARKHLARVADGIDPAAARNARRSAPTVRELGKEYLEDVDARRKESTAAEYRRLWDKHVLPAIGAMIVAEVTAEQLAKLHRRMKATPYRANRVLALLGAFFSFAERQHVRPKHTNPASDVERFVEHARERFLSAAEVQQLGEALTRAERFGVPPAPKYAPTPAKGPKAKHRPKSAGKLRPANPFAIAAIRFLLLSGWRENEALTLQWSDVDFERRHAMLADTKTGRSIRPLGAPALELIEALPRVKGSPYVFPGRQKNQPLVEIKLVWYAVRHAAGLDDVRLHDLRHSFASVVASAGGSLLMIRALLGHKVSSTSARYAHLFDDPVKASADATSLQLANWLAGDQQKTTAAIIPIAAAGKR